MTGPIAIILPHREGFGPGTAGAVAAVVRRLATTPSTPVRVFGRRFEGPIFSGVKYQPVDPLRRLPLSLTQAYAAALIPALARMPAGPIEVHNKPDVATWLSRAFPHRPVSLFLHNDPRTMRGARSPAARHRLLARLAGVVTVSDHLRRALLDGVLHPARAPVTIHNALDWSELPPLLPPHQRERVILFAGRVVADKAPDAFVAACGAALPVLPGWRAQIIGADGFSPDSQETDFIRSLRPTARAAGVEMLGYHPHEAVLRAMSRAAIVVVPSRWQEPFGLVALEAMACGAAVACSNRGGLAEITGETSLLFDPDDPDAGARNVVRLAVDPDLRATLSSASLLRARRLFGISDAVAKLDAFRAMIARPGPPKGCIV